MFPDLLQCSSILYNLHISLIWTKSWSLNSLEITAGNVKPILWRSGRKIPTISMLHHRTLIKYSPNLHHSATGQSSSTLDSFGMLFIVYLQWMDFEYMTWSISTLLVTMRHFQNPLRSTITCKPRNRSHHSFVLCKNSTWSSPSLSSLFLLGMQQLRSVIYAQAVV